MNNIKELFTPLSVRLFTYETKAYHEEPVMYFDENNGPLFFPPDHIIDNLYKNSNLFDTTEFHKEAEFYKARISKILSSLEIADYAYENARIEELKFAPTAKDKIEFEKLRRDELQKYYDCLETIQKSNSLRDDRIAVAVPKIQWLGKTNVLATLFYDLLKGQEKGKGIETSPLLKAEKQDIVNLLVNNFLDSKGNPLSEVTISHYLNKSKIETRAKIGSRIELNH
jgi:hypothetical protein